MVIVKLQGGIGNQLFQFAFGRAIAEARNEELFFDLSFLQADIPNITLRSFQLAHLTNYKIADKTILSALADFFEAKAAILISDDFPKELIPKFVHDQKLKAIYLDGYFQNQFYFLPYANQIKSEIRDLLNDHYNRSGIAEQGLIKNSSDSVSIHIRRTDYLKPSALSIHGICEISYYQEALNILLPKLKRPHLYLFSDDSQFAGEVFSLVDEKTNISSIIERAEIQEKDLVELALMSQCNHFIIANSSYSWWGSYLSALPGKVVIAPEQWYMHPGFTQQSIDIALPSWIRI